LRGAALDAVRGEDHLTKMQRQAVKAAQLAELKKSQDEQRSLQLYTSELVSLSELPNVEGLIRCSTQSRCAYRGPTFEEMTCCLDTEGRIIAYLRFVKGNRLQAIGDVLGLSESRISQCCKEIIVELKARWSKEFGKKGVDDGTESKE
jgi:hypothetical protein